jgi:diguanylate cyclase (GGDEF)-like protein
MCQDPSFEVSDLSDLISRDPALSAKVLRIVNSPLYGLPGQVTSLSRAIMLLGAMSVRATALSFSLARNLERGGKGLFIKGRYWERSLLSAMAAQQVGLRLKLPAFEELFLAGLMQDIGILALNEALGERYRGLTALAGMDHDRLVYLERQHFATDHAHVGIWLAQQWNLPLLLQQAILGSHEPETGAIDDTVRPFVRCVSLSSTMADIWIDPETKAASGRAYEKANDLLGIDQVTLASVISTVSEALPEVYSIFEMKAQTSEELDHIMESSRETLFMLSLQAAEEARQQKSIIASLSSRNQRLEHQSQRDGLTHLFNRAYFDKAFGEEFKASGLTQDPLSLILLDIDHFKRINDTYGHQAGDELLKKLSEILLQAVRRKDVAARYGGEEFALVLLDADATAAARISEKVREKIEARDFILEGQGPVKVTVSVGFATQSGAKPFKSPEGLLKATDRCLYAAKAKGRNCVVGFG